MDVERELKRIRARRAVCEKTNGTYDAAAIEKLKENAAALERNAAMRRDVKSLRTSSKPRSEDAMARFVHAKAAYQTSVQQELGSYLYELDLHRQSRKEMDMLAAEIRRLKMENRIQAAARGEDEGIVADIRVLAAAHVAHEAEEEREVMASRAEELLTLGRSPPRQATKARATLKPRASEPQQPTATAAISNQRPNTSTINNRPSTLRKGDLLTSDYEDSQIISDQKKKRSPSPMAPRRQAASPPLSPSLTALHPALMSPWPQYNPYMPMGGFHPMMQMQVPMQVPVPIPMPMPMPYAMPSTYGYPPHMYGPPPPSQAWPASPQMPYPYPNPYPNPYQNPPSPYQGPPAPQHQQAAMPPQTVPPPTEQVMHSAQAVQPPTPPPVPIATPSQPSQVIPEAMPALPPTPAEATIPSEMVKAAHVTPLRPPSLSGAAPSPSFSRSPSLSGATTTTTSSNVTDALKKSDELSLVALAQRKKMNNPTPSSTSSSTAAANPTAAILPIISRVGSESDVGETNLSLAMRELPQSHQSSLSPSITPFTETQKSPEIVVSPVIPSTSPPSIEEASSAPFQHMRNLSLGGERPSPNTLVSPNLTTPSRQRSISISGSQTPGRISSGGGALPGVESRSPGSFGTMAPIRPSLLRIDINDYGKLEDPGIVRSPSERNSPTGSLAGDRNLDLRRSLSHSRSTSMDQRRTAVPSDPGSSPRVRSPSQSHGGDGVPVEVVKVSPAPASQSQEIDTEDLMRLGSTLLESKAIESLKDSVNGEYSRSTSQNTTTMVTTAASTPGERSSDSRGLAHLQPELCPSPSEIPESHTPGSRVLNRIQSLPERERAATIFEEEEVKEKTEVLVVAATSPEIIPTLHPAISPIPEGDEGEEEKEEEQSPFVSATAAEVALAGEVEAVTKASQKEEKKMESEAMAEEMDAAAEALAKLASRPRPAVKDQGSAAGGKKPSKAPAMLMSLNLSSDIDPVPGPTSATGSGHGGFDSKRTTRQSGDITASPGGLYNRSSSISRSQGSFNAGGSTFLSSGHGSSGGISFNQGGAFGRQSLNQSGSMKSIMSKAISKAVGDEFDDEDDDLEFPSFKMTSQTAPKFSEGPAGNGSFSLGSMKKFGGSFNMSHSFNDDF